MNELTRLFAASPAGRGVRLDVALPMTDFVVRGDVGLLTQVMLNLLKNAGEATAADDAAAHIQLAFTLVAGDRLKISVSDNGPGIPAKYAQDVFLPFFTTKRDGTGVGLSFARQVVLLHGGIISVTPAADGASIELVL